jgi:hypothetical protein
MPSESRRQHNAMEAVEHDPAMARKLGIPQSVAHDYIQADKRHPGFEHRDHVARKAAAAGMSPEIFKLLNGMK